MPINKSHSLLLLADGRLVAYGKNDEGQLGTGDTNDRNEFCKIDCPDKFISVAVGKTSHTLFLGENGDLWGCGSNSYGQLGSELRISAMNYLSITKIPSVSARIKEIAAGNDCSFALDENGCVWSFGSNLCGRLGLGNYWTRYAPEKINLEVKIKSVRAGDFHTLLLDTRGRVWVFGENAYHQLGFENKESISAPRKVPDIENIIQIDCGMLHNLLLNSRGEVYGFGHNGYGQLGVGPSSVVAPHMKINLEHIVKIQCGSNFSICTDSSRDVWVFGHNSSYQLGLLQDNRNHNEPIKNPVLSDMQQIYPEGEGFFAISLDGTLYSSGNIHERTARNLSKVTITTTTTTTTTASKMVSPVEPSNDFSNQF